MKREKTPAAFGKATKRHRWVAVSGGFDPLHIGHVRMMREARSLGDRLVVILNNDHWLKLKKGFVFMPQDERREIIESYDFVDKVVITDHRANDEDMSVSRMLRKLKPHIFANGGDRTSITTPEDSLCVELNITRAYNVGKGGKVQSSSAMVQEAARKLSRTAAKKHPTSKKARVRS